MNVTIDPGLNTGIAIWGDDFDKNNLKWEIMKNKKKGKEAKEDYLDIIDMTTRLKNYINNSIIIKYRNYAVVEGVGFWSSNLTSRTAASTGRIFRLAYQVGMYARCLRVECGFKYISIVEAREWKGQLDDGAVKKRVKRCLGVLPTDNQHVLDAIGIGLGLKGVL